MKLKIKHIFFPLLEYVTTCSSNVSLLRASGIFHWRNGRRDLRLNKRYWWEHVCLRNWITWLIECEMIQLYLLTFFLPRDFLLEATLPCFFVLGMKQRMTLEIRMTFQAKLEIQRNNYIKLCTYALMFCVLVLETRSIAFMKKRFSYYENKKIVRWPWGHKWNREADNSFVHHHGEIFFVLFIFAYCCLFGVISSTQHDMLPY